MNKLLAVGVKTHFTYGEDWYRCLACERYSDEDSILEDFFKDWVEETCDQLPECRVCHKNLASFSPKLVTKKTLPHGHSLAVIYTLHEAGYHGWKIETNFGHYSVSKQNAAGEFVLLTVKSDPDQTRLFNYAQAHTFVEKQLKKVGVRMDVFQA